MISHELRAQATLALLNWKSRNPDAFLPLTEEDFIKKIEDLQQNFNRGLIKRQDFDQIITDMLQNPMTAVGVSQFQPAQKPTESLLRELESLKKSGVLSDDQFEERKAELMFERGVEEGQPLSSSTGGGPAGESPEARKVRLGAYLEELLLAGILSHNEYAMAQQRLKL